MENLVVFKHLSGHVCCNNCGYIVGSIDREINEVILTKFRILKFVPYEFNQTCLVDSKLKGHDHLFGVFSRTRNPEQATCFVAIHNFYCKGRRLTEPCKYSPGLRSMFFSGIKVNTSLSESEEEDANIEKVLADDDIAPVDLSVPVGFFFWYL